MYKALSFLTINTGSVDLGVTKHEIANPDPEVVKKTILDSLNSMGKSSHVLLKYNGKLYTCHHTAARGPSHNYFKSKIKYHPMAAQLA
jgi:hypothetical protein